ncbi:MAG: adenylate kinase family protein [Patescibacteria group bacterium]
MNIEENSYTFCFFGRSGAGKGMQSKKMVEHLENNFSERNVLYIETGKLFREFVKNDESYSSDLVKNVMDEGGLLPAFLPVWMWSNFLVKNFSGEEHLIFDGVARRLVEAPILEEALAFFKRNRSFVVYIDVSPECAMDRLMERGRGDDTREKIKERLDWYEENVIPAIDYFRKSEHVEFISIDGDQTPEEVHQSILQNTIGI